MAIPVPPPTHPCWQRMASGGMSRLKTTHLGTQMLAKRLECSSDPLPAKASEIHAFFAKWERVLAAELAQVTTI